MKYIRLHIGSKTLEPLIPFSGNEFPSGYNLPVSIPVPFFRNNDTPTYGRFLAFKFVRVSTVSLDDYQGINQIGEYEFDGGELRG